MKTVLVVVMFLALILLAWITDDRPISDPPRLATTRDCVWWINNEYRKVTCPL